MEIKNTTVYTKKRLVAYNHYVNFSQKLIRVGFPIAAAIALLGCLAACAGDEVNYDLMRYSAYLILFELVFLSIIYFTPILAVKKSPGFESKVEYTFYDDYFLALTESQNMSDRSEIKYEMLTGVSKNKGDLYLFISNIQAHLVDVSEMSEDELLALRAILLKKLDMKKIKWK